MQSLKFGPEDLQGPPRSLPLVADGETEGHGFESVLVQEGLQLLRSFRTIPDRDVRDAVIVLVKALSQSETVGLPREDGIME